MNSHRLFLQDGNFISNVSICACQTSIPYSKKGLIRVNYNVFIIAYVKYLGNLNNIDTDLEIF